MKRTVTLVAVLAAFPAGMALADRDCNVPQADWQSRESVEKLAQDNGWTVRRLKIDDGCYEIDGKDAKGREIEVTLDPATLRVIEIDYDDDEDRPAAGSATAPMAAPVTTPPNALFGNGKLPQVEVK